MLCISCLAVGVLVSSTARAAVITYFGNAEEANWLAAIGGAGAITATEDFNSFSSDVPGNDTTLVFDHFSITASGSPTRNLVDAPPYVEGQANQDGTPSYFGDNSVLIDFDDDLVGVGFGYLDGGGESQNYQLRVTLTDASTFTFFMGNPNAADFRGIVATEGQLIDSIEWLGPESPFSVDNFSLAATAVPEPASGMLLAVSLGMIATRRKQ
jgi:hypothetical protein